MPRKRTPTAVAKVTGQHPERYANRAEPQVRPLGAPSAHLSENEREAWQEFVDEMPWLMASDRLIVDIAARLSVMTQAPDCRIGVYSQLRLCLSSMGGTPTDRSRVQWQADGETDPADEFIN